MVIKTTICRLLLSVLPAIFFSSSLANALDQESLLPARTTQLSCSAVDNSSPLEKNKKSPVARQISFIYKTHPLQEKAVLSKAPSPSLPFIFSYCLRAPPSCVI